MQELRRRLRLAYRVLRWGHVLPLHKVKQREYSCVWLHADGKTRVAYTGTDVILARQRYEEAFHREEIHGGMIIRDGTPDASWGGLRRKLA